jgi:uncharacterized protein (TIGR02246 family)
MRTRLFWLPAALVMSAVLSARPAPAADPIDKAKEEAALQKSAEAFVEAFNKGDAKAVAAFWTPDGDMMDREGRYVKGRKAIEATYQKFFAEAKGAKLYIRIASLRVPKPDLALEDGETEVVLPDGPPAASRYTVVHVKQDGQWMIESVREATAVPPNNAEHLDGLAFLIGDWAEDVEKGGHAKASYVWNESQNFIVNTFDVTMQDVPIAGGKQIIGWDAAAKKPRAWTFLFNGGFAESVWTPDGDNKWKIAVTGQQRDGTKVAATNVITKLDDDHFTFQFVERTVDGKPLPDDKPVKMKRVK